MSKLTSITAAMYSFVNEKPSFLQIDPFRKKLENSTVYGDSANFCKQCNFHKDIVDTL